VLDALMPGWLPRPGVEAALLSGAPVLAFRAQ
jgi:hypothetical protein